MQKSIYNFSCLSNQGQILSLQQFSGQVCLIVNVASFCGLTNHYLGLEKLYSSYQARGFTVLAFPCNQFGAQEPGSNAEIANFCSSNYQISFPLFSKIEVNGVNSDPLFQYLINHAAESTGQDIEWNFAKFLINRQGHVFRRYAPTTLPESLADDIESLL